MKAKHEDDPIQGPILHEYDGIREADNALPQWWLATFFGTIAIAGVYWFVYEGWHAAPGPREEYAAVVAATARPGEMSDEALEVLAGDAARVSSGSEIFRSNCVSCHGAHAEGMVGPNLTDGRWIHGGTPHDIFAVVRDGVSGAGMPAWGSLLGPTAVESVVSYVLSLRDTHARGRAPQGEYETGQAAEP